MKFLMQARFTQEGVKRLLRDGAIKRAEEARRMFESLGAKIETGPVFTFGQEIRAFSLIEADHLVPGAIVTAVFASGLAEVTVTRLNTPQEAEEILQRAGTVRVPGSN